MGAAALSHRRPRVQAWGCSMGQHATPQLPPCVQVSPCVYGMRSHLFQIGGGGTALRAHEPAAGAFAPSAKDAGFHYLRARRRH